MGEGKRMSTGALVALTAVSAGMSIVQGIQQHSANTEAGIAYMRQAQIARNENDLAIQQKRREIDKVAAQQVMAMAKIGMDTGRGTPLEILHETAVLGQQEIDMLRLQGNAQVSYYQSLGKQQFNNGRNALLGGFSDALTTVATTAMSAKAAGLKMGGGTTKAANVSWGTTASGSSVGTSSTATLFGGVKTNVYAPLSSGLS